MNPINSTRCAIYRQPSDDMTTHSYIQDLVSLRLKTVWLTLSSFSLLCIISCMLNYALNQTLSLPLISLHPVCARMQVSHLLLYLHKVLCDVCSVQSRFVLPDFSRPTQINLR